MMMLCSDRDLGLSLARSVTEQRVKECPLECQVTLVDSIRRMAEITGDVLWILVLDITSRTSCNDMPRAINYLTSSGSQEKFCVALLNYHKTGERCRYENFIRGLLINTPYAPLLTHGSTKKSEQHLVERILRWAMIAGGYRGLLSPLLLDVTKPFAILKRNVEEASAMDYSS
ncbi:uncharacterized protein LOC135391979 isoform X2 [Ornithodoros turicata]|uniref:uncharacterized protein LOC135391979 isoform X2 n=1 Tax=Ornithodoros turicata TaxID=34597 RepID=UPI003139F227